MTTADLSREAYDALPGVNFSTLKLFSRSPAAYRYRLDNPPGPDSDAMLRGRIAHLACFEPERLADVAVWDGRRAGKDWQAFFAANAGREVCPASIFEYARRLGAAARRNPDAAPLLAEARFEVSLAWADAATSRAMKGRLDAVGHNFLLDLKTTRDASPEAFGRQSWAACYHVQMALYADGLVANGADADGLRCYLLAVEADAPHVSQLYEVEPWLLDIGRDTYRAWLTQLAECEASGAWPGYATGVRPLTVPRWAVPDEMREDGGSGLDGLGLQFGDSDEA